MNRWLFRRELMNERDTMLEALSTRQHLRPHEPLADALANVRDQLGVCPNAIEAALQWLELDPAKSIGRLRRTELMQLARSMHRFWRQQQPAPTQPAKQS
jgi:hypothetical protein